MGVAILSCSVKECGGDPTHWIRRQAECIDAANSLASERRRPCNMQGHLSRSHETDVRVGKALRDDRLMEMSMRDDPQSQPISCTLRPGDETYPEGLSKLTPPPAQLHVRGTLLPGEVSVAVVGSRECSAYGRDVAYRIASGVARAGILVVSGLARGIDRGRALRGARCGRAYGRGVAVRARSSVPGIPWRSRDPNRSPRRPGHRERSRNHGCPVAGFLAATASSRG